MGMKEPIFMSKAARLFKRVFLGSIVLVTAAGLPAWGETARIKKSETGLYRDIFDQNVYYEGLNYFHLDRFYRAVFNQELRAANVNAFDEVPDSVFFANRHGREPLSSSALKVGSSENDGPDFSQGLTITKGKFEGLHPGYFVKDSKGDAYLLKFDPADNLELATAAEIITSRFFHAIGYHVPQYTIANFKLEEVQIDPGATTYDDTGFKKKLTRDRFEEYMIFVPQDDQGRYRASASKILAGENMGFWGFDGRRRSDPDDTIEHERRREVRALRVFGSWLNVYDLRESNTLDMLVEENGKQVLKHYLIDFNDSLGSSSGGPKPPMFTHEHLVDYGEAFKSFITLGLWKKPWQKRWDEAGREPHESPAVGYFDNRRFDPAKYKTQLPYYAFKDLSRADGFWAAKIVTAFSDEDIRSLVKAGKLSNPQDEKYLADTLIERRDLIGKYWFGKVNPLDNFEVQGGDRLVFDDLAVEHGFASQEGTTYHVEAVNVQGQKGSKLSGFEARESSLNLGSLLSQSSSLDLLIKTSRASSKKSPYVLVQIRDGRVAGVIHED